MGKKRLVVGLASGVALAALSIAAATSAQRYVSTCLRSSYLGPSCLEQVEFAPGGTVVPKKLPSHELAPVAFEIHGKISMANGGHPPALREALVDIPENGAIDATGLPACRLRLLESRSVTAARRICRKAIVGSGVAHIGLASSETIEKAPLTLFNGGTSGGETRLFVHGAITAPSLMPLVSTAKILRRHGGLTSIWRIPRILEGDGSLFDFRLKIGRRFMSKGTEHSYLAARCLDGALQANIPKILFRNEAHTPAQARMTLLKGSFTDPCVPKR